MSDKTAAHLLVDPEVTKPAPLITVLGKQALRWLFDPEIMKWALLDTFKKLAPQIQIRNPVMFIQHCQRCC
jgi:K+-transporting ATPase ATPase B chain